MAAPILAVTGSLLLAEVCAVSFAGKAVKNLRVAFSKAPAAPGSTRKPLLSTYVKNIFPLVGVCRYRNVKAEFTPWAHLVLFGFELMLVWTLSSTVIAVYELDEVSLAFAAFVGLFLAILNIFLLLVFWPVYRFW